MCCVRKFGCGSGCLVLCVVLVNRFNFGCVVLSWLSICIFVGSVVLFDRL